MKSLKLVDYIPKPKDKVFKLVSIFPDGDEWIKEFSLNKNFEDMNEEDPENTTECFNSLCEIAGQLSTMKVGETIYHQIDRDNKDYKSVIMRIE